MNAKLRALAVRLSYVLSGLRLIWAAARGWSLAWITVLLVLGLLPVTTVYLTRLLVDSLVVAVGTDVSWENVRFTLTLAVSMVGVLVVMECLQSLADWIRTAQSELIQDYLSSLVHEKSAAVDLAFYESSDYYDRLDRARSDARTRPLALLESGGNLLQNGITLLAMATVLIPYGAWLPLVLFVSTLPAFSVVLRYNRRYHRWWEQTTSDRRWTQYYDVMLTHSAVAAELRLFGLSSYFQSAYQTLRRRLRGERLQLMKAQSFARLGASAAALLVTGGTTGWMVWRTSQGFVTLGDLALFYQALSQGQSLLRSLLGNVGQIYNNSLFLENLFEFLGLATHIADPPNPVSPSPPLKAGLRFKEVTFRYPGSDRVVLQNCNLSIPTGQIVAIVGANGAGKSTLIKLLCRFYDPEAGRIELDGVDIREMGIDELRRLITVLFQVPVPYHATAGQNIAISGLSAAPSTLEIEAAAREAGAHEIIARLPRGYDTLLGKWFADGIELSVGEWQRIALARAFLRRAPFVILDEPTSFMDSWAEADWLGRFRELAQGRTALVITHRFTTAMQADMIHVMRQGRILESGSHAQLIAQGGIYAQSWNAQMKASTGAPDLNTAPMDLVSQTSTLRPIGKA